MVSGSVPPPAPGEARPDDGLNLAERLADAEHRFSVAFDQAPIGKALVTLDGRFLRVNQALCRILERPASMLVGVSLADVTHPDDRASDSARMAVFVTGPGQGYTVEKRYVRASGAVVVCQLDVAMVRDDDGTPLYVIAQVQDIDARLAAAEALERVHASQRACLDALEQGVVMAGLDGTVLLSNAAAWRILGDDPQSFAEQVRTGEWNIYDADGVLVPLEQRPVIVTATTGEAVASQVVYIGSDDQRVALRIATEPVRDADGELTAIVIAFADISHELALAEAQRQADDEVRASKGLLEAFLEHSADLMCVHDAKGILRWASPTAGSVIGHRMEVGDPVEWERVHLDDVEPTIAGFLSLLEEAGATVRLDLRYRGDDAVRHLEIVATNRLDDPAVRGVVCNVRDISERAQAAAQLAWQAFHDGLTGLPNRALLLDRLEHALERARRRGEQVALLFVDLDRFKHVNDEKGHDAGDRLLVEVANRLQVTVRAGDTVARLGGDEFVVVAEGGDASDTGLLADRVRAALEVPVVIDGVPEAMSASIGLAYDNGQPPERLLRDADAAMYRAKERGRNRVEVFNESLRVAAQRRSTVEGTLRRALDDGLVDVHLQPIVSLGDGDVVGAEALVRLPGPDGRIEAPGEYLEVAEDRGLMVALGEAVLHSVARHLAGWRSRHPAHEVPFVAVNVSPRQLGTPSFAARLAATLDRHGLRPQDLVVEFTEPTVIAADRATRDTIESLHELGVRLWLDDFGTGYGSLAYLKRFPVDAVKLDQSFVAGLGHDHGDTEIVRAVLALARSLGLTVVAEGVETPQQLRALRQLGCRRAQGYLLGRPAPAELLDVARRDLDTLVGTTPTDILR